MWMFGLASDIHLPVQSEAAGVTQPVMDLSLKKPAIPRATSSLPA